MGFHDESFETDRRIAALEVRVEALESEKREREDRENRIRRLKEMGVVFV